MKQVLPFGTLQHFKQYIVSPEKSPMPEICTGICLIVCTNRVIGVFYSQLPDEETKVQRG